MARRNFIGLRVLISTKTRIQAAAQVKGVTVSEFVRNAAVREARITLHGDRSSRGEVSND